MNRQAYHANGKLLLTAEYFILDGAVGLALPTKFGQSLTVTPSHKKGIQWKSLDNENNVWLDVDFDEHIEIITSSNNEIAETLKHILHKLQIVTPKLQITTKLDFPNNWGLGSSSTLISLLAQWMKVNPYELLAKTFGGSGYDIACATADSAITYQLQKTQHLLGNNVTPNNYQISNINFQPPFSKHLYFLHLNKKQNSRNGILHYKNLNINKLPIIEQLTALTSKIIHAIDFDEFCYYLEVHENIISEALSLTKVKDLYFSDFPGTVKSLGAWGGDFVLVASDEHPEMIKQYFTSKGFSTLVSYNKMIL